MPTSIIEPKSAVERPHWTLALVGLYIYTGAIVSNRFPDIPFAQTGIGVGLLGLLIAKDKIRFPPAFWLLATFVAWCFMASFGSRYGEIARGEVLGILKLATVFLLVINSIRSERQLRIYLLFFLACFVLFPVRGGFQNYAAGITMAGRIIWNRTYGNPNDFASFALLAIGIAMSMVLSTVNSPTIRRILIGCIVAFFVVIILSQSRGVFIGTAIVTTPLLLRVIKRRLSYFLAICVAIATIVHFIPSATLDRFGGISKLTDTATIAKADPEGSAAERFQIYKVALQIVADNPLLGVGLGAFSLEIRRYAPELGAKDPHNTYLGLAAEVGIPGLLLWLVMVGAVIKSTRIGTIETPSIDDTVQPRWIVRALIGFLIAGLFGTYSALNVLYLILGTLSAAALWTNAAAARPRRHPNLRPQADPK
jgi:O-antigen ligase